MNHLQDSSLETLLINIVPTKQGNSSHWAKTK